jgi:hypothetical protein
MVEPNSACAGVSDKTLSEAMGHRRPSTTNTFYRRVDRRHQQAAAGLLEALLQGADTPAVAGGVAGEQGSEGTGVDVG